MGSCSSGGKNNANLSNSSESLINQMYERVKNPKTREDYILALQVVSSVEDGRYRYEFDASDWNKYGKSRTYFSVDAYRKSDGKHHHMNDYGYFDNVSNTYVPSRTKSLDPGVSKSIYSTSGSALEEEAVRNILKKIYSEYTEKHMRD